MSSFPKERAPRAGRRQENDQEDSDEEESVFVAPEHVAHRASVPILGARSGLALDPEHVRRGRQAFESSRVIHVQDRLDRGLQEVPSWPEPLRGETVAYGARDDGTQSTPALLVLRLMIAMCASGLLGVNACFALFDIPVAFLHSRMDEVVFVYYSQADRLVKPGFCWPSRWTKNGTRRASRLWFHKMKFVLRHACHSILRIMSMVYLLASGTTGTCWLSRVMNLDLQVCPKPYNASLSVLSENFASKELCIISPSKCGQVKMLNQIIEVQRTHMVTAYMAIG